ncbi:MAG TPA: phosphoadenylyl-sulfate reductase [Stellaceae bacterium]|nr:phosphoadenylyl-sulfate reductase [Stellaceae bacterium]
MLSAADLDRQAAVLDGRYGGLEGETLLRPLIEREFKGRIALLSSFGAETALLLHMVAQIDADTPVIFLDTGKLFGETLRYRDALVTRLGLRDLRVVTPDPREVARRDPQGTLWHCDADACCRLRKVEPLERALAGVAATISGRKRYHGGARSSVRAIEAVGGRIQVNPLAAYTRARVEHDFAARGLPPHPLEADGFPSIGCMPCTDRVGPAEDRRAGRWRGQDKDECGIHLALPRRAGGAA